MTKVGRKNPSKDTGDIVETYRTQGSMDRGMQNIKPTAPYFVRWQRLKAAHYKNL